MTQAGYLVTGFGTPLYTTGSSPTPFKYGGANGCQTEADTGLVLMGYRYYDTRIGRFISQDKMQVGANWYAYCGNNPVNLTDPLGLLAQPFGEPGNASESQIIQDTMDRGGLPGEDYGVWKNGKLEYVFRIPNWYIVQLPGVGFKMAFPSDFTLGGALTQASAVKSHTKALSGSVFQDHVFSKSGRLSWVVKKFATQHIWDFKNKKGIPSYLSQMAEAGGNFAFGAVLAEIGSPQQESSDGAGGAELVDHTWQAMKSYLNNDNDWYPSAMDNPVDEVQIKAGYEWYYQSYGGVSR